MKRMNKKVKQGVKRTSVELDGVAIAADALKDAIAEEQGKIIAELREDNEVLAAHLKEACRERDMLGKFLKSAEGALAYKERVIGRMKKLHAKELSMKQRAMDVLAEEAAFQRRRAEKDEAFLGVVGNAIGIVKERVDGYGSNKKS